MNHDPGPRKTQSASRIASSVSAGQPGSGGRIRTPCTRPRVEATRCWPRTMVTASGYAGSWPTISASISSGTLAIGSTRPRELSSRPTRSRPSTVSPSRSQRDTMRRLPRAWPASGPSPWNRCWSTSRQVWPHSVSSQSAASAIRRSPGGRTANSSRSRPDDPPSSATVTTAVTRSVSSLSAERDDGEAVAPAEGDDLGVTRIPAGLEGHGRLTPARGRGGRGRCRRCRCAAARPAARRWRPTGACHPCSRRRA